MPIELPGPRRSPMVVLAIVLILLLSACHGIDSIRLLTLIREGRLPMLRTFLDNDPAIDSTLVPARSGILSDSEVRRQIRLYFPRTYQKLLEYDGVVILSASYDLFTTTQDRWMHDAICEGLGGLSGSSLFSQIPGIAEAWAHGLTSQAFPNDAIGVLARGAEARSPSYRIEINDEHPEPILTVFVPLGAEQFAGAGDTTRLMIPRQGSDVLAWQIGSFPRREGYIASWEYEDGRTIATGGKIPLGWFAYPTGASGENTYSPEILSNMIYWLARTDLIDDVEVFHRMRFEVSVFRARISVLLSFRDFVEKLGASTERIDEEIASLQEASSLMLDHYAAHNFVESELVLLTGLESLAQAEEVARKVKDRALLWIYLIEWLAFCSTLFISGFLTWSLMVRRRLYRSISTTRLSQVE